VALNTTAVTKIQTIILIAVIIVASVVAGVVYVYWSEEPQQSQTIKIGICADLDRLAGQATWQGAVLAAKHINAKGGILGRQIELVGEDSDEEDATMDLTKTSIAFTKLVTADKVDFVIGGNLDESVIVMQDIAAEHKKIYFSSWSSGDAITQRVADNYNKYKYYFRVNENNTALSKVVIESVVTLREYTGFNKIGYLSEDRALFEKMRTDVDDILAEENGFDVVYRGVFLSGTVDFSSYFSAAEATGVEILIPLIDTEEGIPFIKEYYDRQSPMLVWGMNVVASVPGYWEWTEGKCEHETSLLDGISMGYAVSNKTLPMRDAFIDKWGYSPFTGAFTAYDVIRYILPDAIERAGTTETEAVIKALEETDIETAYSPRFVFTPNHDVLITSGYVSLMFGQWQNGVQVPICPKEIKEETGGTYTFPPWSGPWDEQ